MVWIDYTEIPHPLLRLILMTDRNVMTVEEKLNSLTHGIGAGMSMAGLAFLLVLTKLNGGGALHYVSFSLYGAFQILLYLSSALTHQFSDSPRVSKYFRIMDQAAIYLLIAGTYTPVALLGLQGAWGWTIFGIIWALALAGILFKSLLFREKHILSDLFYLPHGLGNHHCCKTSFSDYALRFCTVGRDRRADVFGGRHLLSF